MVLKLSGITFDNIPMFENDVEMYGTQTTATAAAIGDMFENDVEMYGTQTRVLLRNHHSQFENDVEMYGTQTNSRDYKNFP